MNRCSALLVCLAFLTTVLPAGPAEASEQEQLLELNLSAAGEDAEMTWPEGKVVLVMTMCMPNTQYAIGWVTERRVMPALTTPTLPVVPAGMMAGGAIDCSAIDVAIAALNKVKDEKEVSSLVKTITEKRQGCADPVILESADRAMHSTLRRIELSPSLRAGEKGTLRVTRTASDNSTKTWTRTLLGPAPGRWLTSYGFNFLKNDDDEFTTMPVTGQQNQYTLKASGTKSGLEFRPGIFFTWIPARWDGQGTSLGISGGLDFNGETVAVFSGPSLFIGDNMHLSAGVSVRQVARLRGEYTVGQTLAQQLSSDQLTQKTYVPAFFAGIGFRFSENPFSKKEKAAAGTKATK